MGDYWTNFAKTGDPNSSGIPGWPKFSVDNPQWMVLGKKVGPLPIDKAGKYDILDRRLLRLIDEMKALRGE